MKFSELKQNLNETIEVETTQWQFSSGKNTPSGEGSWAFEINGKTEFIPGMLKYSEAKKKALEMARDIAKKSGKPIYRIKLLP